MSFALMFLVSHYRLAHGLAQASLPESQSMPATSGEPFAGTPHPAPVWEGLRSLFLCCIIGLHERR